MNILFVNSFSYNTFHQMFDLCFLHSISKLSSSVTCYSSSSIHSFTEKMNKVHGIENIQLKKLFVINTKRNRYREFLKIIFSAVQNIRLSFFKKGYDAIIIPYNNPLFLPFIGLYSCLFKTNIYIVCHGELELLCNPQEGMIAQLTRFCLIRYFIKHNIPQNVHFIVLGTSILTNLKSMVKNENREHFHSINHPFYFYHVEKVKTNKLGNIKFALIGTVSPEKGLNELIILLDKMSNQLDLTIIGRTTEKQKELEGRGVKIINEYLPREEYIHLIKEMDCGLFFYPCDTYKLIASGTIFDAISLRKKVIALSTDYFKYVEKETHYPMILVDSLEEMKWQITHLVENSKGDLSGDCINALYPFSVNYVSNQLEQIFYLHL